MPQLSQDQLNGLKKQLEEERSELTGHFEADGGQEREFEDSETVSVGELSAYDNHPGDLGTETFERERDMAIDETLNDRLEEVEAALKRMETGEYGTCDICGTDIPFERLQALPSTARCIEHANAEPLTNDRPVEEQVMTLPPKGAGEGRQAKAGRFDDAGAWKTVEEYGNASGTVKTRTDA